MKAIRKQYNELISRARELWREREADRLCDAKLMEQAASTIGEMCCKLDDYSQLIDENTKLRELVAHYEIAVTAGDAEPSETLAWSVRCDEIRNEIGGWTSDG